MPLGKRTGIAIAEIRSSKTLKSYALRKNLTHEPTAGGVQSTSGQHSIVSATVSDGDTRNGDIVQNRRFQFSRSARFRSAHRAVIGGQRFAGPVRVRVRWRKCFRD